VITTGKSGRIYIGGVHVSEHKDFAFSYDLSLEASRTMQNRDRIVIDGAHLNMAVERVLCECADKSVLEILVDKALEGRVANTEARFFSGYALSAVQKRMLYEIGQARFGDQAVFYMGRDAEAAEASLSLVDHGYSEVKAPRLEGYVAERLLSLLGVPTASSLAKKKAVPKKETTEWVDDKSLTAHEVAVRDEVIALVRSIWGSDAVGRVRVYSRVTLSGGECLDWGGFYEPGTGDTCLRRDMLATIDQATKVMVHETAHRLAHRFPRRVGLDYAEWTDRSRGFEKALGNMLAMVALRHSATVLPSPAMVHAEVVPIPAAGTLLDMAAATDARAADNGFVAIPGFHYVPRGGWFDRASEPGQAFGSLFVDVAQRNGLSGSTKRFSIAAYARKNFVRAWLTRNIGRGLIPYHKSYRDIGEVLEPTGLSPAVAWLAGYVPGYVLGRQYDFRGAAKPNTKARFPAVMRAFTLARCHEVAAFGGEWAEIAKSITEMVDGVKVDTSSPDWLAPFGRLVELERARIEQA
jgi:hypothetical protein